MLFAISGAQGCGKSTIIAELEKKGFRTIERKTSRSILADWGMTLSEINDNPELSVKFQDEIITRKIEDEAEAITSKDIWITERSYIDLFVYTLVNLGKHNEYSEWVNQYYERVMEQQRKYAGVFYIKSMLFDVVHDGVRGSNQHYSRMIDSIMREYNDVDNKDKKYIIDVADLGTRVEQIERVTQEVKLDFFN